MAWKKYIIPLYVVVTCLTCQPKPVPEVIIHAPFLRTSSNWVDSLMNTMTLDEKIGQLFLLQTDLSQPVTRKNFYNWVGKGDVGGFWLQQLPMHRYLTISDSVRQMSKIPLFSASDERISYHNQFADLRDLPLPATISAVADDTIQDQLQKMLIYQSKALGINFSLAPSLHIQTGRDTLYDFYRFESDEQAVVRRSEKVMQELQDANILAVADDFSDYILIPNDTLDVLDSLLYRYNYLSQAGLSGMLINREIFTIDTFDQLPVGFLKTYLHETTEFEGLLIAKVDSLATVDKMLHAGIDLFIIRDDISGPRATLRNYLREGRMTEQALNAKVQRVLLAKAWLGLDTLRTPLYPARAFQCLEDRKYRFLARQLAERSITLVQNYDYLVPFKNLDRKSFRIFQYGEEHLSEFKKSFNKYAGYTSRLFQTGPDAALSELGKVSSSRTVVVVTLDHLNIRPERDKDFLRSVHDIGKEMDVVLVNFGSPLNLQFFDSTLTSIQIYQRTEETEIAAAQLLFGALSAEGRIPLPLGEHIAFGQSNPTEVIRLKHTVPEEVGIAPERLVSIDALALNAIAAGAFPGCQILLAKDGKIFYSRSFGYHSYDEKQEVTDLDLYDIASITKVASTTLAGMKLFELGRININDALPKYLDLGRRSTLRYEKLSYLLAHRSRIQANMPVAKFLKNGLPPADSCNRYFCKVPQGNFKVKVADSLYLDYHQLDTLWSDIYRLRRQRRRRFRYSDVNFNLLQKVFEKQSGKPLDKYVHQQFYRPLNLRRTLYNPLAKFKADNVVPTAMDSKWRGQLLRGYVHDESAALMGGVAGNAGLFANAEDLAVLFQMLLNDGRYGGTQFLNPETIRYFTSPKHGNHRGLGFDIPKRGRVPSVARDASNKTFGHTGFTGTCVWADPETDLLFIFLSNRIHPKVNNRKLFKNRIRGRIHQVVYDALNSYDPAIEYPSWPGDQSRDNKIALPPEQASLSMDSGR